MRFGLLGTGPWATAVHAPVLAAHTDVEFVGVWGRRQEAAAELAASCGTRPYQDLDALLADVDAVAVALPPAVQSGLAVRAAEAGCHLLLDKPLAVTVPEAREAVSAAADAGVASVVFFTTRFGVEQSDWISEQAAVGGWFTGRADWLGAVFTSDSPFAASPWRREKGALWDVGPHALSVLLPVLGEVTEVTAVRGPGDTVHLVCRHSSGAAATATLSLTAPPAASGATVELRGESGVAVLPERNDGPAAALHRAVDALRKAAATGVPHPCDAAFGLRVVEVLAAAEHSLATGTTAALATAAPRP
ncbi:Gfo/Idh/MocA family protein [Peterkaempfera bronchialis]|uniref:Gfo/Idh/MocA family oxidoreductase n=1 Tax=Peterkaempfera bronchialis TaxID=2126346 RepID=A0A345STY0_9ACTN|nr:Gfo/Idh/MocA family oxidoreductase [Peterkaempfera bronchialis]AXI77185.1 gfo/Idh/MocA family oxidoreductase [Peterkaempfera bronchialis]